MVGIFRYVSKNKFQGYTGESSIAAKETLLCHSESAVFFVYVWCCVPALGGWKLDISTGKFQPSTLTGT